jgi:hypothetical protein
MQRKARLYCSPCLIKLTKVGQLSGEIEVCHRIVTVGLDGSPQPRGRFGISPLPRVRDTDICKPQICEGVARRETERLTGMCLGLRASTNA